MPTKEFMTHAMFKFFSKSRPLVGVLLASTLALPVLAQVATPMPTQGNGVQDPPQQGPATERQARSPWSVGIGSFSKTSAYADAKGTVTVLPLLGYDNGVVKWQGPTLDVALPVPKPYAFSLHARYQDDGYSADDSIALAGMEPRKASVWLGVAGGARVGPVNLTGQWMADALGNSKGQQLRLGVATLVPAGKWFVSPRLALVWQDAKTVDYYYGVKAHEVTASRKAFSGEAATSVELGVAVVYAFDSQHAVVADLSTTRLPSGITDSPLVSRSQVHKLRLGYAYRF
jgi:MipA family protein